MSTRQDSYLIYVEKYANFLFGVELNIGGCGEKKAEGSAMYDERGILAVEIAADDVRKNVPLRSRSEFEGYLKSQTK